MGSRGGWTQVAPGGDYQPLLEGEDCKPGKYELVFQAGRYFRGRGVELSEPAFLEEVVIRFGMEDGEKGYHVPLLTSPWAYSTYRGS